MGLIVHIIVHTRHNPWDRCAIRYIKEYAAREGGSNGIRMLKADEIFDFPSIGNNRMITPLHRNSF